MMKKYINQNFWSELQPGYCSYSAQYMLSQIYYKTNKAIGIVTSILFNIMKVDQVKNSGLQEGINVNQQNG